jgi:hypothetical protein
VQVPASTLDPVDARRQDEGGVWARRAFVAFLAVLVGAGVLGLLGDRTDITTAEAGDYELSLRYATTARAGLDVPWEVTVTRDGGFEQTLELAVTGDYFDIDETQGFTPEPSEATRDGETLYLTFETPPGDTFVLAYDAYIQPASQIGRGGTLSVVEQDVELASVDFHTRLLP